MTTLNELMEWASCPPNNLICNNSQLPQLTAQLLQELTQLHCEPPPKILLAEQEPVRFLAGFIAACAANCPIFLGNYNWVKHEWQQVFDLVQPDIIWGQIERQEGYPSHNHNYPSHNLIMIPTGGSSGKIEFAMHTWETLMASVRGFQQYFQLNQVNSYCLLPLYHVSGLMQFMRSFTTGGKLVIQQFKQLEIGEICDVDPRDFFISLVPTQLQRLLQNPELTDWLSQFNTVLLGGAPAWNELLEQAKHHKIRLAPTYGMTETASQIATLKPDDFLNGKLSCGQILPHAKVTIRNSKGQSLKSNKIGNITIQAKSLALGYYPDCKQDFLQLDDLGFFDEKNNLNIVGRNSDKIITGGENVYPAEVEAAIRATEMVVDICVIGIPDEHWGQVVTAVYVPKQDIFTAALQTVLQNKLSKFKIPKQWISVETLHRNSQGKINRQQIQKIAVTSLQNS